MGGSALTRPSWVTDEIDLNRPSASRVYDYYLGGFHNFSSDREMAEQAIKDWPDLPMIMKSNRAFLRRAVSYLVEQGVRQFLDIGSGIPTVGNVHEVAHDLEPESRIVYVDLDPVAVAHSRAILADNPNATVLSGDLRKPDGILADLAENGLLDLDQPVALLMVAVLHFVGDQDAPAEAIATLRDALAPRSYLTISHATHELHPPEVTEFHRDLYRQTATPMTMRTRAQVEGLFAGFELVEPGVVLSDLWHPDADDGVEHPERFPIWAGLGRKP
jgi:S-adenosyl methyltransferase